MCASAVRYVASSPGPHPRQGATAHVVLRPYHASQCIQVHTYSHTRVKPSQAKPSQGYHAAEATTRAERSPAHALGANLPGGKLAFSC